jgi:hypothetical protein
MRRQLARADRFGFFRGCCLSGARDNGHFEATFRRIGLQEYFYPENPKWLARKADNVARTGK